MQAWAVSPALPTVATAVPASQQQAESCARQFGYAPQVVELPRTHERTARADRIDPICLPDRQRSLRCTRRSGAVCRGEGGRASVLAPLPVAAEPPAASGPTPSGPAPAPEALERGAQLHALSRYEPRKHEAHAAADAGHAVHERNSTAGPGVRDDASGGGRGGFLE